MKYSIGFAPFLLVLALSVAPTAGLSQAATDAAAKTKEAKTPQEVNIEADQMEILDVEKKAIFKGNVSAMRGNVHLTCDTLDVTYAETAQPDGTKKTDVNFLDAAGNVKIVTARQTVTGQWAKMDIKANDLTVGGAVKVVQGSNVLSGSKLFVDLDTNKSELTGGRVKGSFLPGK